MGHSPLDELAATLAGAGTNHLDDSSDVEARPDLNREGRTGVPEVIYARGKDFDQISALAATFVQRTGRAIVSRLGDADAARLTEQYAGHQIRHFPRASMLVIRRPDFELPVSGRVGIITAGTSDLPAATEARVMAEEMGCATSLVSDVGVAGIHRLFTPLRAMLDADVDVIIVAAGMDGALPSVVSGLVDVPVIGLPTSTGYGVGGRGIAALLSMLQTCAPGLSVVNVDNGVGAGVTAALIAKRANRVRQT